jgi:hypothetical protein
MTQLAIQVAEPVARPTVGLTATCESPFSIGRWTHSCFRVLIIQVGTLL